MQPGNSKHAAWLDEHLAHDTEPFTRRGPGSGHADTWRDREPTADDDLGVLTGRKWVQSDESTGVSAPQDEGIG
jgi:hypothetical protein